MSKTISTKKKKTKEKLPKRGYDLRQYEKALEFKNNTSIWKSHQDISDTIVKSTHVNASIYSCSVMSRAILSWIWQNDFGFGPKNISRILGVHHATVIYYKKIICNRASTDKCFRDMVFEELTDNGLNKSAIKISEIRMVKKETNRTLVYD